MFIKDDINGLTHEEKEKYMNETYGFRSYMKCDNIKFNLINIICDAKPIKNIYGEIARDEKCKLHTAIYEVLSLYSNVKEEMYEMQQDLFEKYLGLLNKEVLKIPKVPESEEETNNSTFTTQLYSCITILSVMAGNSTLISNMH
jgi:hypothetical protein